MCHAYQILKKGGLKDENIIVLMYDDIAHNSENPTPGIIINKPNGPDVYAGVPKVAFLFLTNYISNRSFEKPYENQEKYVKEIMDVIYFQDYTKSHTNAKNLYAVLLGNKTALTGGSGKVVKSGPNDNIFVYYADHGSPGILGKLLIIPHEIIS